jgi:hypothetical protein
MRLELGPQGLKKASRSGSVLGGFSLGVTGFFTCQEVGKMEKYPGD